ncbi:hypothetical protein [Aurantiacibacter sp. MUD61]|uniref:hypothetical protein n=1 Tax=Aurantiacibacter sp. MUD61 TaxID=3009083 RepID=UPI0022F118C1|nr:hypothetical protein [Aurantiacibacter sp. MUD61]
MDQMANGKGDNASKENWSKPEFSEFELNLSDVKNGYAPGSDGDLPGPPDTSLS